MARSTIGLAVNQTIMMALSMIVITALIDAPGLGESIITALQQLDVGRRVRGGPRDRPPGDGPRPAHRERQRDDRPAASAAPIRLPIRRRRDRRIAAVAGAVAGRRRSAVVLPIGEEFPEDWRISTSPRRSTHVVAWIEKNLYPITDAIKNVVTEFLLNPLQAVLTTSPWWLVVFVAAGIALIVSGRRAAIVAGVALVADRRAPALGARDGDAGAGPRRGRASRWSSGSRSASGRPGATGCRQVLRPINDAAQTMPSFVYLLPAVALFGADPVHGDPGRRDLRRAGGHPAGRGRDPRRLADRHRGGHGGRLEPARR